MSSESSSAQFESPGRIYAGTSGWAYPSWKPEFYPAAVSAKRFLEYYASRLNSVEVNYTFRSLPSASMLTGWLATVPAGFRFSFKAPQRITHFSRLRNCDTAVQGFVNALAPVQSAGKLGTLLFQLPPNFKADPGLLREFLSLPALRGEGAPLLAFEFRHPSWFAEDTYSVLSERNAALCIAQSDELRTPEVQCATTHACYRLRISGGYTSDQLAELARRFCALATTRHVHVYFKHEDEPTGALNAVSFLEKCTTGTGK